jgi:hypothetical protein
MKCAEAGCKKSAMKGSLRCYQHSPEAVEARKALAARMIAARKQKREARLNQQTAQPSPPAGWWSDDGPTPEQKAVAARQYLEAVRKNPEQYSRGFRITGRIPNAKDIAAVLLSMPDITPEEKRAAEAVLWPNAQPATSAPKPDLALGRGLLWTEARQL